MLLDIDPRDYTARLMQARAVLQAALTKQQAAQSSVELVNVTSNAGIQQAAASVALAKSAVQTAHAQIVTARSRLEQARAQVDTALANAAQARAQVAAAEAEVTRADADGSVPRNSIEATRSSHAGISTMLPKMLALRQRNLRLRARRCQLLRPR